MPIFYNGANTNYTINGTDFKDLYPVITREYLIDLYPSLIDNFRFAGLWLWGRNIFGDLGTNDINNRSSPVQTVAGGTNWKQISTGAGIKSDGTLWLWGLNSNGQLGDNTITHRSSPVQTIAGGTNWKQVNSSGGHTAAIKTDGTLWLWGYNQNGTLGNNETLNQSSPVQTISAGTNWKQVSCRGHTAAIKTDGTLWLWGKNDFGQLGTNDIVHRSSPIQTIPGGTNWKQVSCGDSHTAAIKTDGTLWTWGLNISSQLGVGGGITRTSSPIQTVSGGTNWKQVSCGASHTAAIKTDGTLWLWGSYSAGQLGISTPGSSIQVQTISGGTNWKQVSCGFDYTAAIKTDGTLWLWGYNQYGKLGDNTVDSNKSSPVQTIAGGTNWKQVVCGDSFCMAIRDDSSDPFRAEPI